ncbi:hypothetical protein [Cellulomonas citrea]|uniref:hypothetical protein n=1 Tax=Cellulomonas citrea TaxID=1909423 RepID=UPI00135AF8A9|nr:hypothetical protein [Cellulomonas citrea]
MNGTIELVTMTGMGLDEGAQREVAAQLVEQARVAGIDLVGTGGLLAGLAKQVLEAALEKEGTMGVVEAAYAPDERGRIAPDHDITDTERT